MKQENIFLAISCPSYSVLLCVEWKELGIY